MLNRLLSQGYNVIQGYDEWGIRRRGQGRPEASTIPDIEIASPLKEGEPKQMDAQIILAEGR